MFGTYCFLITMSYSIKALVIFFAISVASLLCTQSLEAQENRSFDGTRNNLNNIEYGSVGEPYVRFAEVSYTDGIGEINSDLPNPREISNVLFAQDAPIADENNLSDFVWAFGQFVCHDIEHVRYDQNQSVEIPVPSDDEFFDVGSTLTYFRKQFATNSGTDNNPREYLNDVSTYIDGSVVYGSDEATANWLRTFEDGKLRTSSGNFLPWNTETGEYNSLVDDTAPFMKPKPGQVNQKLFVTGDERANKNPALISLHTIFVREHNSICDELIEENPSWDDERIYQRARKVIGAYIQKITYEDWLPSLGIFVEAYNGYNSTVDPSISNEFSAAGIVFQNTLIGPEILRLDNSGNVVEDGNLEVGSEYYYNPTTLFLDGIEPYLKGMSTQVQQKFDTKASDNIRNFDFADDVTKAKDRVAERIFEGRDRGVASYNAVRRNLGLTTFTTFINLTGGNAETAAGLEELYDDVEDVDLWVGLLAEGKKDGEMMGEIINNIIKDQFRNLRDGDRFYYENDTQVFSQFEIESIKRTTLHDLITKNTNITIMQENVFSAEEHSNIANGPQLTALHLETAIYPNPSTDGWVTLKMHADFDNDVNLIIVDLLGREMHNDIISLRSGDNFHRINLTSINLQRGYYVVLLKSGEYENTVSFLVE